MFRIFLILILNLLLLYSSSFNFSKKFDTLPKEDKLLITDIAIASAVIGWGFAEWGYGEEKFHLDDEGWFEKTTSNGGSDKLGHFYTNYLITRLLSDTYNKWGYSKRDSALYASLTSVGLSGFLIEVGDGFSEHGFSKNDFIADSLGALFGYIWYLNPSIAKKIDFRFEYDPFKDTDTPNQTDFTTDYERMKHLVALKLSGFDTFKNTPLKYVEFHLGYFSRHFNHDSLPIEGRERNLYVGVGLNLSELLNPLIGNYSKVFNYFQVPHTYIDKVDKF